MFDFYRFSKLIISVYIAAIAINEVFLVKGPSMCGFDVFTLLLMIHIFIIDIDI